MRCRYCGQPVNEHTDNIHLAEGGFVHRACAYRQYRPAHLKDMEVKG